MSTKANAFEFFRHLEGYLNNRVPNPSKASEEIWAVVMKAKASKSAPHLKRSEEAFLNHYIVPGIHDFLVKEISLDYESARQALLSENYRHIGQFASGTPARSNKHPFTKVVGTKPQAIMEQWKGKGPGHPIVQSCPDMALRPPCPYKVVIEGKFFSKGGVRAAETILVTNIYQAFFYRALPTIRETPTHAAWDYDYACLLAYDGTDAGNLQSAWQSLERSVKTGIWEGANIYVMILRGSG